MLIKIAAGAKMRDVLDAFVHFDVGSGYAILSGAFDIAGQSSAAI